MKGYILTLLASAVIVSVLSIILPEGNIKKYAVLVSSIIISMAVIVPFKSVLDISGIFSYEETDFEHITREDAENIYKANVKSELKKEIENNLSAFGRAYVTVSDDLGITGIEIYTETDISEDDRKKIKDMYNPERLEIIYDEYWQS